MTNYSYRWTLAEAHFAKNKGKVFSCFACGGGSTMGYKLAGFDVIGCNDNDPAMMEMYRENHNPKFSFLDLIQDFKDQKDLPKELFDLDILDGSPPCSSFSMAGNRERDWGKKKKFREGQAEQILDTLFFDFIDLAKRLQPKVIIAENVKGMLSGKAQGYVARVISAFDEAGYFVDFQLLNASRMGIPQKRERVFFYAIRKDLHNGHFVDLFKTRPQLRLEFNETPIPFGDFRSDKGSTDGMTAIRRDLLDRMEPGDTCISDINERVYNKVSGFTVFLVGDEDIYPTIISAAYNYRKFDRMACSREDYVLAGSFPLDYNFGENRPKYVVGMSVPPLMIAHLADAIHDQWLTHQS